MILGFCRQHTITGFEWNGVEGAIPGRVSALCQGYLFTRRANKPGCRLVSVFQSFMGLFCHLVAANLSLALKVCNGGVEYRLGWEGRAGVVEMEHMRNPRRF